MLDLAWQSRVLEAYHNIKLVKKPCHAGHLPTGVLLGMVILIYVQFVPFFYFSLNVTSIFLWVINVDLGWVGELLFFFFSLQPTHYNISGVKE